MPTPFKDVRNAAGMLPRNPVFTVVAVLALGLGLDIGVNTAIFNVVRASPRRSLTLCDPSSLTVLDKSTSFDRKAIWPANYPDSKGRNHVFGDLAAVADIFHMKLTGTGEPEKLPAAAVSANFFQMIGVQPVIGRAFLAAEETRGRDHVVILSHQVWRRRFGGNVGVLGRSITLSGENYRVIGVLPVDFSWNNRRTDVWVPYVFESGTDYPATGGRVI
jgi:putative ABC transport system permease protein